MAELLSFFGSVGCRPHSNLLGIPVLLTRCGSPSNDPPHSSGFPWFAGERSAHVLGLSPEGDGFLKPGAECCLTGVPKPSIYLVTAFSACAWRVRPLVSVRPTASGRNPGVTFRPREMEKLLLPQLILSSSQRQVYTAAGDALGTAPPAQELTMRCLVTEPFSSD